MERDNDAFVVAVKRDKRSEVPPGWVEIVRTTPGVTILGEANPARLRVRASPEGIEHLRRQLGESVYIEKLLPRARY